MPIKVGLLQLGCSKNQVDGEGMAAFLSENGYKIVSDPALADVMIVNTCGFIESAQEESINSILEMASLKKSGRLSSLIVTGCLSQVYKDDILKEMPEVDGVLGTGSYSEIKNAIESSLAGNIFKSFGDIDEGVLHFDERALSTPRHFAYMKIAEGCDNFCSYCAIPKIRGRFRSREISDIVSEAKGLIAGGAKELILIAQDVSRYGLDMSGTSLLPELLRELSKLDATWIRLQYLYPEKVTDELLEVISENEKILPYFDIPLQHSEDRILKRMNRRVTKPEIRELIGKIRSRLPDATLRTTFITGFPGETDEDFSGLLEFITETEFDRLGVFAYSRMDGTPAAAMEGQIDEDIKNRRAEIIMELQANISERKNSEMVGKTLPVLVEGFEDGQYFGRSPKDSPEVDPLVYFSGEAFETGSFAEVFITGYDIYDLYGEGKRCL